MNKIINIGQTGSSQNTRVIDSEGISYAVTNGEKDGVPKIVEPMCSVHPLSHKLEFNSWNKYQRYSTRTKSNGLKAPHVVYEPQFLEFSNFISLGSQNNSYNRVWKTEGYCGAINCTKQMEILEPQVAAMRGRNPDNPSERGRSNGRYKQRLEMNENGTNNTLTGVQKDNLVVEPRYRIRKLTPRECFRLMDVDDADINKIQEAGISNSQQYKMAGNSIVVACLYHLFRKMFTEPQNEERQLTFW